MYWINFSSIDGDVTRAILRNRTVVRRRHPGKRAEFTIQMRLVAKAGIDSHVGPLHSMGVRQALNQAIDKNSIIANVMGGRGEPLNTPSVPGVWGTFDFDPLPFDAQAARAFGGVAASLRKGDRKASARAYDAMIAATALAHGLPVYTCNANDFAGIEGLDVVAVPVSADTDPSGSSA